MKNNRNIKRAAAAIILIVSMLLSAFVMVSCGSSARVNLEKVPEEMKSEARKSAQNDIDEGDRAAYTAKIAEYEKYLNGDYSVITDLYPEDYWAAVGGSADEAVKKMTADEEANRQAAKSQYGEGYKVTCKIESEKNYSLLLESLKSTLKENFGIDKDRVSRAYNVYVTVTVSGPKNKSSDSYYLIPTNIDGNWYLVNQSGGFN